MTTLPYSFSFSTRDVLGFQRAKSDAVIPAISISKSRANFPYARLSFRNGNVGKSEARERVPKIFANPTEGDIVKGEESAGSESGGAQGPPFLTILAGFLVFFFICWVVGSFVTWLFSIIVTVPPAK